MSIKIAVATNDGIIVNEHFGRCGDFLIFEIDEEENILSLENRKVTPVCHFRNHDAGAVETSVNSFKDCQYVLCLRIGFATRNALINAGIKPYEIPGVIEEAIHKMLSFEKAQKLIEEAFGTEKE